MRMKRWLTAAALLLACGGAFGAGNVDVSCDVDSDYDFSLSERSVILTRDSGVPHRLVMRQGRLFVDDAWVALDDADRRRLVEYEREARAVVPLARDIGREAAEIAFIALGEVAAGFSSDPDSTRRRLDSARAKLDRRLAGSVSASRYSSRELGDAIGLAVREVLPTVMGDIVGGAVRAAFSGDIARMQRMENLDAELEALIEPRAEALGRKADDLCARMETLDRIDDALQYRLPDGRPLDLLRVERKSRRRADGT
ncbi:DUF2884 family protein [Luteimonas sp. SJ-92]|uniref:DUF2884 family protein n=1 Tax=Luteimonas salinisoli TaxID=2752307 RepID=A0A853J8Z2_9GAMM|nr:DUF2884 family protein [Luteimonas salinisoli]NZA25603.1 DUF2884 family protein [Luteimonas salinisoli]